MNRAMIALAWAGLVIGLIGGGIRESDLDESGPSVLMFRQGAELVINVSSDEEAQKIRQAGTVEELFDKFDVSAQGRATLAPGGTRDFTGPIVLTRNGKTTTLKASHGKIGTN